MKNEIKTSKNFDLMAERFILSAILEQPDIFIEVNKKIIKSDVFYCYEHKIIYSAMIYLLETDNSIDQIMLINAMKSQKTYDESINKKVDELSEKVLDISSWKEKALILIDKWKTRQTERMADRIKQLSSSGHCSFNDMKNIMENYSYLEERSDFEPQNAIQVLQNEIDLNNEFISKGEKQRFRGIPTMFKTLSKFLVYRRKNITMIAARPAMGKSSLALNDAFWQASNGFRVVYFTHEMANSECCNKLICQEQKIKYSTFELMSLEKQNTISLELMDKLLLNKTDLIFNDYSFFIEEIHSVIKSLHKIKPIDIIYIDFIQDTQSNKNNGNRNAELSKISRDIKLLTSKYDFAAVILSQLNRDCEKREDKRPILADLRDSGSLEQDATTVIAIYRDEIYNENTAIKGETEILFLKNRFGPIGRKKIHFESEFMLFTDIVENKAIAKSKSVMAYKTATPSKFKPNFEIKNSVDARNKKVSKDGQQEAF